MLAQLPLLLRVVFLSCLISAPSLAQTRIEQNSTRPARLASRVSIDPETLTMTPSRLADLLKDESARLTVQADAPVFRLIPWKKSVTVIQGVVESPKGSRNKYELDKRTGLVRLDRRLAGSVPYPIDYGFVPQTLLGDCDPLDMVLIVNEPTFPGCVVEARVLGVLTVLDEGKEDFKVLGVPDSDPQLAHCRKLDDVPLAQLAEISHFFNTYKQVEGKRVEAIGWSGCEDAVRVLQEAHRRWQEARRILGTPNR